MANEIVITNLYKAFGRRVKLAIKLAKQGADKAAILAQTSTILALSDISLQIKKGKIFVIIGLSGAGKSTLIRHLNRLIDPDEGQILVQGQDILKLGLQDLAKLRQTKVSMVFQNFGLFPHWNVQDNVAYGLFVKKISKNKARQAVMPWLEAVGLSNYKLKYPDELSGGMLQRVGLARAFATDSDIILMDEPFSSLDPLIRREMQEFLIAWQTKHQKTIVFITHDIREAFRLGQKIAILKASKLIQVDTPTNIQNNPANDYVARIIEDTSKMSQK
ncbi:MAG: ATP-binding cassette domain-containing protein [SAR324 cluster bacterium]|nr:ATP-binding cassette domain-containing protein [SAR324 cluster bacterium]